MNTLTEKVIALLVAFVNIVCCVEKKADGTVKADGTPFRGKALDCLKALFVDHDLSIVPAGTKADTKGSKAANHNDDEQDTMRVTQKGLDCPLVVKPVWKAGKADFLCFVLVPDVKRMAQDSQLEAFCIDRKDCAKHDDYITHRLTLATRQKAEDIRNDAARSLTIDKEKQVKLSAQAQYLVGLDTVSWENTKKAFLIDKRNKALCDLVDTERAKAKS